MTTKFLAELLHALGPNSQDHAENAVSISIERVTADSRQVDAGTLFVAVAGRQADGHRFIPAAYAQGAAAVIGAYTPAELASHGIVLPAGARYFQVDDSRLALAQCAAAFYDYPSHDLTVIGVTGTDGKTTTSALIEAILAAATQTAPDDPGAVGVITTVGARIRGLERDTGFHVTTPDAPDVQRFLADMRKAGCRYAVVESTSHGLDQARVAAVAFDVAAVTNITHEHLDYHGSRDAYVAAKAKLFRMLARAPLKPGAPRAAILNADDTGSYDALRAALAEEAAAAVTPVAVHSYGVAGRNLRPDETPDLLAERVVYAPDYTRFVAHWWGGQFDIESRLIGDFNVYNVLAACAVGLTLGIEPGSIQQAIAQFTGVIGRMERIDRGQPFLAVVDFAHTPVSLERALLTLRTLVGADGSGRPGRLIAVFGCAGLRDQAKRYLMGRVSGRLADFTVITAEDPRTESLAAINAEIVRGVREAVDEGGYVVIDDRATAIQYAVDMAAPGDVVAAFGKGHERSMCFGKTEYPWSDQDAMIAALDRRKVSTEERFQ